MSRRSNSTAINIDLQAVLFAALGDPTRLQLVNKLVDQKQQSISSLTEGSKISRQAITKHLTVLENVGLVEKIKDGRESLYQLDPQPLESIQMYLEMIARQWDQSLNNLKKFVEEK